MLACKSIVVFLVTVETTHRVGGFLDIFLVLFSLKVYIHVGKWVWSIGAHSILIGWLIGRLLLEFINLLGSANFTHEYYRWLI